jgi:threonine/homoserine/homoserine lactone efflux protein
VSKSLALAGLVISGLVVVLFVADLAAAFPFRRTSVLLDLAFIACGLILAYLSWSLLDGGKRKRGGTQARGA